MAVRHTLKCRPLSYDKNTRAPIALVWVYRSSSTILHYHRDVDPLPGQNHAPLALHAFGDIACSRSRHATNAAGRQEYIQLFRAYPDRRPPPARALSLELMWRLVRWFVVAKARGPFRERGSYEGVALRD